MTRGLTCCLWLIAWWGATAAAGAQAAPGVVNDSKVLDSYTGRYQVLSNFILVITREGDHLMVEYTNVAKFEVFPRGDKQFFSKAGGIGVTFKTDAQGRATGLTLHQAGTDLLAPRIEGRAGDRPGAEASPPKARKAIVLDPKLFDACCAGQYQLSPDFVLKIFREGNRFFGQGGTQPKYEIFAESRTDYFLKEEDIQITFELDARGKAIGVIIHQFGLNQRGKRID
jgi:hypothetical protein